MSIRATVNSRERVMLNNEQVGSDRQSRLSHRENEATEHNERSPGSQSPSNEPEQGDMFFGEESIELNKKEIEKTLQEMKASMFSYLIIFCSGYLMLAFKASYLFIVLGFLIEDILVFAINLKFRGYYTKADEKCRFYIRGLEVACMIAAKVLFVVWKEYGCFKLSLALIPICLHGVFRLGYFFLIRSKIECAAVNDFIVVMARAFLTVQGAIITLKLDSLITWEWRDLFWLYWIVFSILVGLNFGVALLLFSRCCIYCFGEANSREIKSLVWLFLVINGITVTSSYLMISIIDSIKTKQNVLLNVNVRYSMIVGLVYTLITLAASHRFRVSIQYLMEKVSIFEDDFENEENIDEASYISQPRTKPTKKREVKKINPLQIPRFLKKLSSTYFKKMVDQIGTQNNTDKQQTQKDQAKIDAKPSRGKHRRSNSESKSSFQVTILKGGDASNTLGVREVSKFRGSILPTISSARKEENDENSNAPNYGKLLSTENALTTQSDKEVDTFRDERMGVISTGNNDGGLAQNSARGRAKNMERLLESQRGANDARKIKGTKSIFGETFNPAQNNSEEVRKKPNKHSVSMIVEPKHLESFLKEKTPDSSVMIDKSVASCLVCYDNPPDAVIMECGHGGLCRTCALEMWQKSEECYLCREKISHVLQIDLSHKDQGQIKVVAACTQEMDESNGE